MQVDAAVDAARLSACAQAARQRAGVARESPVQLDAPPIAGQYDSNATVTSVATFGNCPRRYYLERYLGWTAGQTLPAGRASEPQGASFGLQVHALLAGTAVRDG